MNRIDFMQVVPDINTRDKFVRIVMIIIGLALGAQLSYIKNVFTNFAMLLKLQHQSFSTTQAASSIVGLFLILILL